MIEKHVFNCGCEIDIINGHPKINYKNINLNCKWSWAIYANGQTQSIFQLESYLGKKWSKELKPTNIKDAAALISIIRPGVLQAHDENGDSLTKVFCDRKRNKWKPNKDSIIENLLSDTVGIWAFQEQVMEVTKIIAGFDGVLQVKLVKAIGKKQSDLLLSLKKNFLEGCKRVGIVSTDEASVIFDNIERSGRYLFNLSHAVGYAKTGYWTAWVKAHLPQHYICSWLRNAKNEQKPLEEIRAVISESRRLKIPVLPPSLKSLPSTNFFIKNEMVFFGLDSIKGCGEKGLAKLRDINIDYDSCDWVEFLIKYSKNVNKTQMINMIRTGCFDFTGLQRIKMESEYNQYSMLNKTEKSLCEQIYEESANCNNLSAIINVAFKNITDKRKPIVQDILKTVGKTSTEKDSKINIIAHEKELLGINVTCSHIQRSDIPEAHNKCSELSRIKENQSVILVGEISEYREITIKNGKLTGQVMASFTITDESGYTDCVCFPKELNFYQGALYDGNIIMIEGKKSNRGSIALNKLYEV